HPFQRRIKESPPSGSVQQLVVKPSLFEMMEGERLTTPDRRVLVLNPKFETTRKMARCHR
ncbi:MAG: hypothetical protein ABI600_11160, partial [Luteolibacter sp.]